MAKLTQRQLENKREKMNDDAQRGVERFMVKNCNTDLNWIHRKAIAVEVIAAIERCHIISERKR